MVEIDDKTYRVRRDNYYKSITKKTQIILASSLRKDNYHIVRLKHKKLGKSKEWSTFTISRDGKIYQHYDPKYYSDFMKMKDIDKKSISIVLENMGELIYDIDTESYLSAIYYDTCDGDVFEKEWRGFNYWEKYTDEQFESTLKLCEYLCEKYVIPPTVIGTNNQIGSIKQYKGIVTRSNFDKSFTDLNPSFNLRKFYQIFEEGEENDVL